MIPFGIRSALGFGGVLSTGNLYAVVLFVKVPVPRETADLTKALAPDVKAAIEPFAGRQVFNQGSPSD